MPDVIGKVVSRHAVYAFVHHNGRLERNAVLDRKPVSVSQQWCHVIKLSGSRGELNSGVLHGLQAIEVATRKSNQHGVAVIQPRENKARDEHCTCTRG